MPCHQTSTEYTFGDKKILIDGDRNTIEWNYLKKLVEHQYQYGLHAKIKIRNSYINRKNERSVKYSTIKL